MKIIVGLGNPGKEYEKTRHNFGFQVVDALSDFLNATFKKSRFKADVCEGYHDKHHFLLVKPTTFMNLSGEAVGRVLRFYKKTPNDMIVAYDDLDLPVGRLKFYRGGSAGGHNGITNIIELLGSKDFHRLRLGIGRPEGPIKGADYVLSKFKKAEQKSVDAIVEQAVEGLTYYAGHGIDATMNQFNPYSLG